MTGGLVLGEALNLWIPAEQMIFGLAVWLLFLVCVFARRKSRYGLPVFLFVAGMSAGCLRMGAEQAVFSREEGFFREEHEDGVVLQGTVQSVKEKDGTLEVVLRDCAMEGKDGESGEKLRRVLCYLDVNKTGEAAEAVSKQKPSPAVGEKIRVFGEGKATDPARNPGAFDYRLYCRSRGISGIIYVEGYTVTGGKVHVFSDSLYRIRRCFSEQLKAIALPEDAGILSAVLFGEKDDLDSEIYELYRKNGISHLLAISGLHVSIVGLGIWKIFRKGGAGFWISGIFAGGFLCAYGMMVGSGASVARAVSMAGLSFLAAAVGRTYDLPTAMCIPAAGLLLAHPYLLSQASFQLSFLAVTSLIYPGRLFSSRGEKLFTDEKISAAASAFFTSLSTPGGDGARHSLAFFWDPALRGVLKSNRDPADDVCGHIGISWTRSVLFIRYRLGSAMLGGAHYILRFYEVDLQHCTGELPGAELVLGQPEVWKIGCYYGCLILGAVIYERGEKTWEKCGKMMAENGWERGEKDRGKTGKKDVEMADGQKTENSEKNMIRKSVCKSVRQLEHQRKCRMQFDKRKRLFGLTVCWLVAFCFLLPSRPNAGLSATFLDVGQGDGIVLRSESDIRSPGGLRQQPAEDPSGRRRSGPVSQEPGGGAPGSCRHDPRGPGPHQRDPVSLWNTRNRGSRVGGLMMPEAGTG